MCDLNMRPFNHNLPIFQMQLEISNAQRSEFEERSLELAQEVRDVQEERKIGEKKSGALAKDLKRQLLQEKQRNDKLSDKLDKLLAEASANVVIGIEICFFCLPHASVATIMYTLQCPSDIATLDIAAALSIATSTPMELGALALHK